MAFLPAAVAVALWVHGGAAHSDPWLLSTDQFQGNHYQSSPYVANGYFGQRLPAEGVGYWIYRNESTGENLLNCE